MDEQSISEKSLKETVKTMLEQVCGKKLNCSTDCQTVVDGIWNELHEHVSLNTVKRITGFLPYEKTHRRSTLDIVARFLGYNGWDEMTSMLQNDNSGFEPDEDTIIVDCLNEGDRVVLTWYPDRTLRLVYQGDGCLIVEESINGKLMIGDVVRACAFTLHSPLFAFEVLRGDTKMGEYTAGKVGGITSMRLEAAK